MSNVELAVHFFLQIAVILLACRVLGFFAKRLGQPQVVAEMIAGVLLGPSLLGWLAPEWQLWLFPWDATQATRDTQSYLFPAAQLGLALYMFIVGMEFRTDILRKHLVSSLAISVTGMVAPFILGAGLAAALFYQTKLFTTQTNLFAAMLFLGASLCITAFPMLARIIHHKRLGGTTMGTVSLGAGAIDDATAWCLLALVLASLDNDFTRAIWNIAGGIAYVAVVLLIVRPLVARWERHFVVGEKLSESGLVVCLSMMALGAWFTDQVGLHAVFGAFVMGTAMPRDVVARDLIRRLEPLTISLLIPLFFAFSGLNTKITLLNSGYLWGICGAVLAAAVVGKGVACWLAARATGMSGRESLGVGILMNVRGMMGLIIINIGLSRGIITEGLFAVLTIMAIATTLMASPLFDWWIGNPRPADIADGAVPRQKPVPVA